ncbi:hypothetical protein [Streptomyces sp. NPDC001985]|uniref:imine reductase family protein n=1 Tax=Streptomyces sp. NPDC001985 TaxID=3154406 RepID=UPI00332EE7EC
MLHAGDRAAFEANRAALGLLGPSGFAGDDAGPAAVYGIAVLSGTHGMFSGFLQAVALARSEGITAAEVTARPVPWLKAAAGALRPGARAGEPGVRVGTAQETGVAVRSFDSR